MEKTQKTNILDEVGAFNTWFDYEDSMYYSQAPSMEEIVKLWRIVKSSPYEFAEDIIKEAKDYGNAKERKWAGKIQKLYDKWTLKKEVRNGK